MSTNRFFSFMVIFVLSSCSSFDYNKVIQNKKILLRKIENTSLVHRNSNIIFTTYNRSKANNYYLKEKQGIFIFENDSIEYSPNLFSNISKNSIGSISDITDQFSMINLEGKKISTSKNWAIANSRDNSAIP